MATTASTNAPINATPKAWSLLVVGYSTLTVGLLVLLTTNGASGIPTAITIGTAALIGTGLLLPAAGMLQLRRGIDQIRRTTRRALAMQGLGLIGLLFGALALAASSGFLVLSVSAFSIVMSGVLAIMGAILLRGHYADVGAPNPREVDFLILGTALIFCGVSVILWSNLAYYFLLSDLGTTIFTDVGVGVTASGCVTAAYFFFVARPS